MTPNTARAIASGLTVAIDLSLDDRSDVKAVRASLRESPDDLPLYRRDRACATAELQAVSRVDHSGAERPRERGSKQHQRREAIDLVQHHLVVEHDGPGQPHVQAKVRLHSRRAECGLARLRIGVHARRDDLADVPAEQPLRQRGRDELVSALRVGHRPAVTVTRS